jgi:hypothetical protein
MELPQAKTFQKAIWFQVTSNPGAFVKLSSEAQSERPGGLAGTFLQRRRINASRAQEHNQRRQQNHSRPTTKVLA